MKILKQLNKFFFTVLFAYLFLFLQVTAEDKPIDIWDLEKKENEETAETNISDENISDKSKTSVFDMQSDKENNSIKLEEDLLSRDIKIVGLYDPQENGLSIDMWVNSDGHKLKNLFKKIDKLDLSNDASEIMNVSLLTNTYYPSQNITEKEFLKFKTNFLIKNSTLDIIEEFLINNQVINSHPQLTRYLIDNYLSESNIKKSCEFFSKIKKPVEDEYLSKFNLYCLINYGKNEEAQLILDLKKELGFQDEYFENKINYLFGYIEEASGETSENSILDFHLAHRTNSEFSFQPNENTSQLVWKYLSTSNLLPDLTNIEISEEDKISVIEKATHFKIYSEKDLFKHYKQFQFNINQLLDVEESIKSLSSIQSRALVYQRTLLTKEPNLKLKFVSLLKELFQKDEIDLAFDLELLNILSEIKIENVSADFMTFYEKFSKKEDTKFKTIKFNNKILHQSKWINYFRGDYSKSEIEEVVKDFLDQMKFNNNTLSIKDVIFIESLKSDGIEISSEYDSLYAYKPFELDSDLQTLINDKEIGTLMLTLIEIIGKDKIENIDEKRLYFIFTALNQINADLIRNKLLLKVLPLKV
tara:strand:+ start:1418 stop:3178 length:1761 start_codon:yes stop_codon:yes gene_type:complete